MTKPSKTTCDHAGLQGGSNKKNGAVTGDKLKADPFFCKARVRIHVLLWVSNTIGHAHVDKDRRSPCELHAVV